MEERKVKIRVFYRGLHDSAIAPTIKERYMTTFILDKATAMIFLQYLLRGDIDRVEMEEMKEEKRYEET